jgi:hypothetical protein
MGTDEMETEFFGSSRPRPSRSERSRAKREQRRRLRPLRSSDPEVRTRAAVALAAEGLDHNATTLLDFVGDESEATARAAVAHAVLAAPVGSDPGHPAAKLRDWAQAEAVRQGGAVAAAAPPPAPAPFFAGPAPVASAASSAQLSPDATGDPPVSELALSPDDRWRTGTAVTAHLRPPARPRAAMPRPGRTAGSPPPPAPPHPLVVGGTIGTPSVPEPVLASPPAGNGAALKPAPVDPAPEPDAARKTAVSWPAAAPVPAPEQPAATERSIAPEPVSPRPVVAGTAPEKRTPAPAVVATEPGGPAEGTTGPATWRIVKASPVDIVVWEPAEPAG